MNRPFIDLNSDLGEGAGSDPELMELITSANIACGGHAGDTDSMRAALLLARAHRVRAGAHPGYEDQVGFGRIEFDLPPDAVFDLMRRQILALIRVAEEVSADGRGEIRITHVKPHGALYNQAARDADLSRVLVRAIQSIDPGLVIFGLAGGNLTRVAEEEGMRTCEEIFADRRYAGDGSLVPRSEVGAVIHEPSEAVAQALRLIRRGAGTLCVHGDHPGAVEFAREVRRQLIAEGLEIRPAG